MSAAIAAAKEIHALLVHDGRVAAARLRNLARRIDLAPTLGRCTHDTASHHDIHAASTHIQRDRQIAGTSDTSRASRPLLQSLSCAFARARALASWPY